MDLEIENLGIEKALTLKMGDKVRPRANHGNSVYLTKDHVYELQSNAFRYELGGEKISCHFSIRNDQGKIVVAWYGLFELIES